MRLADELDLELQRVAFEPLGVYHCLARETGELVFYGEPPELADFFAQLMREEG